MSSLLLQGVPIKLGVQSFDGVASYFTVHVDTPLEKLFQAVCLHKNIGMSACKFVFDGVRLLPHQIGD